jgi:hypothetical protein
VDTPAHDAAPLTASPGLVLDERYRLDQVRADHQPRSGPRSMLWRAIDDSLGRFVAVQIVQGADAKRRRRIVKAATKASTVADARFVRVYDVGEVELDGRPAVWIAYEWIDAPSLATVVRDEPLPPPVATDVARQCAEAMDVAADAGLSHGRLHPDQVHLPLTGAVRISGLATAAVVHDVTPDEAGDVRALGALLFAALTGRWPLAGWHGLPSVGGSAGAPCRRPARPRHADRRRSRRPVRVAKNPGAGAGRDAQPVDRRRTGAGGRAAAGHPAPMVVAGGASAARRHDRHRWLGHRQ